MCEVVVVVSIGQQHKSQSSQRARAGEKRNRRRRSRDAGNRVACLPLEPRIQVETAWLACFLSLSLADACIVQPARMSSSRSASPVDDKEKTKRKKEEDDELEEEEEEDEYGEREVDDDEDDDDEEEEDDEKSDAGETNGRSGRKRKKRRQGVNRYVDVEAVVDDEEEEFDDEDTELLKEGELASHSSEVERVLKFLYSQMASSNRMRRPMMMPISGKRPQKISFSIYGEGEKRRWTLKRLLPSCARGTAISED